MPNIITLQDVLTAEEQWRDLFNALDLLNSAVLDRMGEFDDNNFTSLKVIQELVNDAKHIAEGQWKGLNMLVKMNQTGVIEQ